MTKISKDYAYSLGMLYVYLYSNGTHSIISLEALENFYNCLEYNLEKIESNNFFSNNLDENKETIYYYSTDENGKEYYILKPDFNLEQAKTDYMALVPTSYIIASEMSNALDYLGLVKLNGSIQIKRDVLLKKQEGECCATCEYTLSSEVLSAIKEENSEYRILTDEEFFKQIGFCELEMSEETIKNMGYWCPNYVKNERLEEQESVLKKIKKNT